MSLFKRWFRWLFRRPSSLHELNPRRYEVPVIIVAGGILLGAGLFLPGMCVSKIGGLSEQTYSIVEGVIEFARGGDVVIALVIFAFSVVFPIVKLAALAVVWYRRLNAERRRIFVDRLEFLGKWSMLDGFVVAAVMWTLHFGFLVSATPRPGIYVFAAAILVSMFGTLRVAGLAGPGTARAARDRADRVTEPLAALALTCLVAGICLPLLTAEKLLWGREYSIVGATAEMAREGHYLMAAFVALFVIVAPLIRPAGQLALRPLQRWSAARKGLERWMERADRWAMADVFSLALLIVVVKMDRVLTLTPRAGLWFFIVGAVLSLALPWPFGRLFQGRR